MYLANVLTYLAETETETETASTGLFGGNFFNVIMLAASAYILYGGIKGTGSLYDTSAIKEGKEEEYRKYMRLAYIVVGAMMLINSGLGFVNSYVYPTSEVPAVDLGAFSFYTYSFSKVIGYVTLGLVIASFLLIIFIMRKYVDKEAAEKKAQEAEAERKKDPQYGHSLPISAFEFDEEEPEDEGESAANENTDEQSAEQEVSEKSSPVAETDSDSETEV